MNCFIQLLCVLVEYGVSAIASDLPSMIADDVQRMTAMHYSKFSEKFHRRLENEVAPHKNDPVIVDRQIRKRICEDIADSTFFLWFGVIAFHAKKAPRYSDVLFQFYNRTDSSNSYSRVELDSPASFPFEEYVFLCPLEYASYGKDDRIFLYVSKEYNVAEYNGPYKPGRFVFGNVLPRDFPSSYITTVSLLEEPAEAYMPADFNVEIHYLRIRKYAGIKPVKNYDADPLCKLTTGIIHDSNNQHTRICVAVLSSAYFRDKFRYPLVSSYSCSKKLVSFKTPEGVKRAAEESFYELMTHCYPLLQDPYTSDNSFFSLYISRAYASNQIFVYLQDFSSGKIYLENLSTNMSIVDEINSFDFIEY